MEEEDQERRRKLEAGKAKLAQFRQRKGQTDSQNATKKSKKKKSSSSLKPRDQSENATEGNLSQSDEAHPLSTPSEAATTTEFTIMRTVPHGEIIKHDQAYNVEPESEISTTADDYSSEEEEFGVRETYSEHGTQSSPTRLEVMEDELPGKHQEIDELNRELEEMRAAYGTEGFQQLQEFESAIKQRDDIITQLTTNLQLARKEKDEIMREFLELTEQSQKLKIQFQHLQASESLRSTSHTSTATDLLHSKQQIFTYQQQLEEQEIQMKHFQKQNEDYQTQIGSLQEKIQSLEQVYQSKFEVTYEGKLHEKDVTIDDLRTALNNEESISLRLKEKNGVADKLVEDLREQLTLKNSEINGLADELSNSKQKERMSSEEIKQLMGIVEDFQKKHYKGTQSEAVLVQRMELETQNKLQQLQAELDEMYGQQIVQMKQELIRQHTLEIEKLILQHKATVESISIQTINSITNEQIDVLHSAINELNIKLQDSNEQRNKMEKEFSQQLEIASSEKSRLQRQIEELLQDLGFAREQIQKAKQSITEKETKLSETSSLHVTIEELKSQLSLAAEFTKELESKHDSEVTNYKIKLDMLEREKDAVLDRMAESQEAELEKLRTHFLFSQEEELSKLRDDLTLEHRTNIENLKDNLDVQYKTQIERVKNDMSQTINAMQSEKDDLITKQNHLMLEISKLNDLLQSMNDSKSEEMIIKINELQREVDSLRKEEKEKGTIEQEAQMLQLRIELLENEVKDKETLNQRVSALEMDNRLLKDENYYLQIMLKKEAKSENPELNKEVEKLTLENMQLRNLELQLKEEIERQKNTFSFAEKNFEVNYQELQEENACLLKLKEQLEDNINKQEEKYKVKLHVLQEELAILKNNSAEEKVSLKDSKSDASSIAKLVKADTLEGIDVVEKDTTELMEKLEIAQRDKEELAFKLSDLSVQLQLKQTEIIQLKEEVKCLCQERDDALSGRQKLVGITNVKRMSSVQDGQEYSVNNELLISNDKTPECSMSTAKEDLNYKAEELSPNKTMHSCGLEQGIQNTREDREFLLQRLNELTMKLENESVCLLKAQNENTDLQSKLTTLYEKQVDMKLQLEAQHISLTQIHIAQLELITKNVHREKEEDICSLKEEMLNLQEQKIKDILESHHKELHAFTLKQTGCAAKSCQTLTEILLKTINEEHDQINQCLNRMLVKPSEEIKSSKMAIYQDSLCIGALQKHIHEMKTVHGHLTMLLENFLKKHQWMVDLQSSLDKVEELQTTKEDIDIANVRHLLLHSQTTSADVQEPLSGTQFQSDEIEKLKMEFSQQRTQLEQKHSQEIEHLRFYFQQELKENEERYTTEIIHLQGQLHNVSDSSAQFSDLSESQSEVSLQESDILNAVYEPVADISKMNESAVKEDKPINKSSGIIYQQLQNLRQALSAKYAEEVETLKKQHDAELLQLTIDLKEKYSHENATLKQELAKTKHGNMNGSFQEHSSLLRDIEEEKHMDINQLLEERYHERIEEEIARVIVEMTIAFAQKTELARLAAIKNGEIAEQQEARENLDTEDSDHDGGRCMISEEHQNQLQSIDLTSQVEIQRALSEHDLSGVELIVIQSSETSLSTEKHDVPSLKHLDQDVPLESHVKTVVLKEDDYNQMVAMGAESAKLRLLYEERVEDMRQELVRQEQEYQQATEALRLSHMSQLERQMYDQEQLLAELHMLRTQLAETALVINENQATEREKMLLEELESLKKPCWKSTEKQDNATQTQLAQDETVTQAESKAPTLEGGHVGEGHEESKDTPSRDLTSESLKKANKQLLKILFEIVKTTGAVEETIGRHVIGLLDKSGRHHSTSKFFAWSLEPENPKVERVVEIPIADHAVEVADTATDKSIWSGVAEERLDLPLPLTDVEFAGLNLNPEDEAQVLNISIRLQAAVEKLLEAINETSNQLEHAKAAQTELVHESIKRKQETTELLRCQEELQERLNEEAKAKEHLALELSKAEGLLDGYTEERVFLEKQMQEKTDLIRHLEQELLSTGNRLQEFEQERQQIQEERELLCRQKNALKADASPAEQQLLEETEKLLNEKIEVQRQAEKDSCDLHKHMKVLEAELEEQMNRYLELEQEKNAHLEDLRQKNLALEKQLDKTRKFLDEQAVDREHERDVFQQEIQKLELQLKMPQRHQPVTDHQNNEVEKLESNLKEKTDKCSELLLGKEQLQRDVQERNEEIEKLECRIRELEQALLSTTDSPPKVEERKQSIVSGVKGEMPLEDQLQEEREAIDRKEKEITNLEEQLEQFREELENKNEEVQQLHMQLEIQRKESATQLQEQEQQIKVLTDELDNLTEEAQDNISFNAGHSKPEKFKELLQEKDKEMDHLNEQIGKLQAQLLAASDNKEIEEKNEQIKEYKIQIKCLKSDQERLKKNSEEEIEKLNEVIEKLQEELANIEPNVSMDFTSMTEVAESSKHQLEGMMAEKESLQQEANVNDAEVTHVITELEMTQAEVKQLKKELEKLRKAHNKPIGDTTLGTKHGKATINSEQIDNQEKVKEESVQFSIHNLEKELQRLQKEVKDKDIELVQYAEQIKQLKLRSQEVEHLNEMIEKLQMQLGYSDQKMPVDFVNSTEGAESSKHQLETVMGEKMTVQKSEMSSTAQSLVNSKLDAAYEDLGLLSKEFENLRKTPESTKGTKCEREKVGIIDSDKVDVESLGETPREKGTDMLENQSLLSSVQEAMQSTIQNIELQLLDSQKVIQDKDLTLLQYSAEIKLLKTQVEETEHLNEVISALHKELEDIKKNIAVGFDSREDYHKNGKHNLGAGMNESVVLHHKLEINSDMTHSTTELENTETEINILKQDLKMPKTYSESSNVCESNEEMVIGEKTSDIQKLEEALTEKTAELLANQTLLSSVQEAMKSTEENLKSQLHECQNVVKEKELQLLQYMSQAELLNERTHEVEQLNGVIDTLEQRLATIEERASVECLSGQSNQEGAKMADDESSQLKMEVNVTDPNVADRQSNVKSQDPESCTNYDVLKETLREKTAQLLATQALLTSLQDTSQHTVKNMEAQLQEHQNVIKEKDLELLQYLHEIELLKKQADSEHDKHGEIISAMEDKLREKVASALVSEAQMKAIQVQSKLMHKPEDVCILADGSVATQTDLSKSIGEEEVESKLSVLSLRLLQLEKQLADLHEQLQLEKEHVTTANQQAAERENKLHELQHILENMKESQDKNFIESQSEDTLTSASQELFRPSQSVEDLEQELQRIKAEAVTTKEELCHFREVSEKLKEELMVKETNVAHLQEELQHVKQCLTQAEEKLAHYMEEQGIQENLAIGVADSVDSQEQTNFDRKTSSSQTDRTLSVNNSNQTPPVHLKDIGVQNEFVAADGSSTSDEVTQIMEQFTEKIGQMQDLHAAEILDMEARHISEADSLRREQYVAVRALTEECEALKAVIDSLRTPAGGVIPDSALPASGKFTDTASSDGTSEWSQGTYTVHNFEPGPDGVRSDDEFSTDFIPNKIKNLLRAVHQEGIQVLTLTEPQSPEKETKSVTVSQNPWLKERKSFLETISSLKALIGKLQIHKESEGTENSDIYECIPDWRGELLRAVQEVFCKEQDVLLAAFHTQLAASSSCDAAAMFNQMQLSLQEQGMEQINAMDCLQNADRRSMLLELRDLREQLISLQNEASASPQYHQKAEDVVSYHLQQENPHPTQELILQLDNMNAKAKELQGQLHSEKVVVAEIKKELAQTKAELEATLKIQHKHFNELETLRLEVKQRTNELDEVNSTLENEQKKSRELQWALEKEKAKIERREEREREELEDLKILVEDQRLKNTEVTTRLEEERQKVKELNEKIASLETVYDTELSKEKSKVSELQAFLDLEKSRTSELMNTIECRRELETQIQTIKGNEQEEGYNPADDLINELQSQLDSKHKRIVELMSEVESYKLECTDLKQTIEQERLYHKKELNEVKKSPHQSEELLKSKVDDLQRKLDERTLEVQILQADEVHMKQIIHKLQNSVQVDAPEFSATRREQGQSEAGWNLINDQENNTVQIQKGVNVEKESRSAPLHELNGNSVTHEGPWHLENLRLRLQQVSAKLKQLAAKANQRVLFETADDEDFVWSQNTLQEVVSQLDQLEMSSVRGESMVIPAGTDTNSLTERLLTQNAELTGYVSRLTEEKNDLRNALLKLEGEACRNTQTGPSGDHCSRSSSHNTVNIDVLIATERELWTKEKLSLQKSLKQSEAELAKLKAELRNEDRQRSLGRESENMALKRIYGKYLRSESYRKALVYQKKYLLLLLGGFQECEEATLALIARMGGQPSYTDLEIITHHSRAFMRFRSAVRVSIAISRMKFLVRRWQRATSFSPGGVSRSGFGQSTGNELRTDSPYLPAGNLELYGDQRHSSSRSRSGFESPQSTVNSHHRYSAVSTDPCSHLQHYDPDRALTDYINRLEALQKRLGSVQSGSSAITPTHYGTRR